MAVPAEPVPVLIVDADPAQRRQIVAHLGHEEARRFRPVVCATAEDAARLGATGNPLVIADLESIGGLDGLRALAAPGRSLIATSAKGSLGTAVAAIRAGATDFLPKPLGPRALLESLKAALANWQERVTPPEPQPATRTASPGTDFENFVGRSPAMDAVYRRIERFAPSRAPVLVTGETGTGKEVAAEAIHALGGRDRPFVAVNCAALPRDLVESEIFGHVRGAFTGADADRSGAAELAHGGTLFLDEIAEMPPSVQAKLLRFVQAGELQRVGSSGARRVDVRVIAATHRDLPAEIAAGRFREDLFHRLNVLTIALPPLRDRRDDIPRLTLRFLETIAAEEGVPGGVRVDDDAAEALHGAPWSGNVRQLQNAIRRMVVIHRTAHLTKAILAELLPASDAPAVGAPAASLDPAAIVPFHVEERQIIETAITASSGSITRAAAALGLDPSTIYRKRQNWKAAG